MLSINLDIGDVVLENGGNVNLYIQIVSMQFHQIYVFASQDRGSYRGSLDAVSSRPRKDARIGMFLMDSRMAYLWESTLGEDTST